MNKEKRVIQKYGPIQAYLLNYTKIENEEYHCNVPAQPARKQYLDSSPLPTHGVPPSLGSGHAQSLVRFFTPEPHVFEQRLQGAHSHQSPFTRKKLINFHIFRVTSGFPPNLQRKILKIMDWF